MTPSTAPNRPKTGPFTPAAPHLLGSSGMAPSLQGALTVLVALDVLWWLHRLPGVVFGVVEFFPADLLALLCLPWCLSLGAGDRSVTLRPTSAAVLAVMCLAAMLTWGAGAQATVSVMAASALEEVIFRFCWPWMLTAVLVRVIEAARRRPARPPTLVASTIAAFVFAVRPGHLAQVDTVVGVVPFVAFALLMSIVALRCGSLVVPMALHVTLNLVSLAVLDGSWPRWIHPPAVVLASTAALAAARREPATAAPGGHEARAHGSPPG